MATHYSKDGKDAYQIKREHPECPYHWATGAKSMTSARIDFEISQDAIIEWYNKNIYEQKTKKPLGWWFHKVICEIGYWLSQKQCVFVSSWGLNIYYKHLDIMCEKYGYNLYGQKWQQKEKKIR